MSVETAVTEETLQKEWNYPFWLLDLMSLTFDSYSAACAANPFNNRGYVYWVREYKESWRNYGVRIQYRASIHCVDGVYKWVID